VTENKRLRIIRKKLGYTQKDFSQQLEMKQGSYSDIERGKVGISSGLLRNLIVKYRVNPLWLFDGHGPEFISDNPNASGITDDLMNDEQLCENCTKLEQLIQTHIKTIQIQQEYITTLKTIVDSLKEQSLVSKN
jgi:transcriptional regulator with XRE-family HTH domain